MFSINWEYDTLSYETRWSPNIEEIKQVADFFKTGFNYYYEELNYKSNAIASSLRRNLSKTIGVIIPLITNSFYALAIDGIVSVAKAKGYHVLIYIT